LYIKDDDEHRAVISENGGANLECYVNCCNTLNNSLLKHGHYLTVLTNKPEEISKYNHEVKLKKIAFHLDVPADIRFYSAHYKIDAFKYLSNNNEDEYSVLLDNDIICINNMPENFKNIIGSDIPMCYDITDQVYPAYGRMKIIQDKSLIMGIESIGNWAGGEFIGGSKTFWAELYNRCMGYWENYKQYYKNVHHQSDEMLVSCAIEKFIRDKESIINIGSIGGVSRFWSIKTLHIGKPIEALYDNFLLHLPADKRFLSNYQYIDTVQFINDYKKFLKSKPENITTRIMRFIRKLHFPNNRRNPESTII
jgi:hypothetical protein